MGLEMRGVPGSNGQISDSSACLACGQKTSLITSTDKPPKGFKIRDQTIKKHSEDFWTASAREMDNSAVHSQRSISSVSTSTQTLDAQSGPGINNSSSEFVNHGLLLWNQTRQQWVGNRKRVDQPQEVRESKLNWNATYDNLFGSNKPFSEPIPLSEMVEFLVEIWEEEGMYD